MLNGPFRGRCGRAIGAICASPKRSACSITMMVASGTSTPTSITVVATSSCVFAGAKRAMAASLSGAFHAAMHQIDFLAESLSQLFEARLRGREIDLFGFLDQRADPIGALAFGEGAADGVLHFRDARHRDRAGVDWLAAGGFSRNSDTSMSPKNVSTSVRGIGVAVSTSTSTASPFCASARR